MAVSLASVVRAGKPCGYRETRGRKSQWTWGQRLKGHLRDGIEKPASGFVEPRRLLEWPSAFGLARSGMGPVSTDGCSEEVPQ